MQYNIVLVSALFVIGAAFSSAENGNAGSEESVQELANFPASRKNDVFESNELNDEDVEPKDMESKFLDQDLEDDTAEGGRNKIKIKKKHKKYLMEALMAGLLAKSALLPLAVGFLKLLTGKALFMTMLALGLAMSLTFKSATEKTVTTEVINLVPHNHRHRRSFSEAAQMHLSALSNPKNYS